MTTSCKLSFFSAWAALFLFAGSLHSARAAEPESAYDRVIRTGVLHCGYVDWPPYFNKDAKTGVLTGLDVDLSDAVAKVLGLKIDYVPIILGEQVQDLRQGKVDAICGDGPWIISTAKYLEFSTAFHLNPVALYVRENEARFAKMQDLNRPEVKFAALDGDISQDLEQFRFAKAAIHSLPQTLGPSDLLTEITSGKADVSILDPAAAEKFNAHNPQKVKQLFPGRPFAINKAGFSVLKGEIKLLNMLNEGLDAARNVGMVDEILDGYDPQKKLLLRPAKAYDPNP